MIRIIYTFFVGLFLAIFVGMGIAVFYPQPTPPESPPYYGEQLSPKEKVVQTEFETKQRAYDRAMLHYNRNASMIILTIAVVILVVCLLLAEKLGPVADGLLLGGIFTLLYGIGRGMATDNNKYRFLVASVGLLVTLVLGYFKFTRHQALHAPNK